MWWFRRRNIRPTETVSVSPEAVEAAMLLYIAKNFQGQFAPENLPPGFPEEMWNTASPEIRTSWIRKATGRMPATPNPETKLGYHDSMVLNMYGQALAHKAKKEAGK